MAGLDADVCSLHATLSGSISWSGQGLRLGYVQLPARFWPRAGLHSEAAWPLGSSAASFSRPFKDFSWAKVSCQPALPNGRTTLRGVPIQRDPLRLHWPSGSCVASGRALLSYQAASDYCKGQPVASLTFVVLCGFGQPIGDGFRLGHVQRLPASGRRQCSVLGRACST